MSISYTRTKSPVCTAELVADLNASLSVVCIHVVINDGDQVSMFFQSSLDSAGIEEMEEILANHVCTDVVVGTEPVEDPTNPDSVRDDMIGSMYQFYFGDEAKVKNKWLNLCSTWGTSSDASPAIIPWKSRLVGITFSNKKRDVDCNVDVFAGMEDGNGYTDRHILSWELRDVRAARKTDITDNIIFEAGEKVGVFLADKGGDPERPVVTLYFHIMADTKETSEVNSKYNLNIIGNATNYDDPHYGHDHD